MLPVEDDKSANNNLTPSAKQRVRDKLQREIEEYLKKGNAIVVVPLQKSKTYAVHFDEY